MFKLRITAALFAALVSGSLCKKSEPITTRLEVKAVALLVVGDVKAGGKALKTGEILSGGQEVSVGPASMLDLQIRGTQTTMRVKENSVVSLTALQAQGRRYSIHLNSGRILTNVSRQEKGQEFEVVTPAAVASVRGTRFDVFVFSDGTSRTVVFDGSVATRIRVKEIESLPPELLENSQALRKVVAALEDKERVVEAGQESTVTHYVIEADLKEQINQVVNNPAVRNASEKPLTPEEARAVSQQIDRDLEERLAVVQKALAESHPESKVEIRQRAVTPPEGYPTEQEFEEFKPVPDESLTDEKASQAVADRNRDAAVRQQLLVRIERVTGGRLDRLVLRGGRVVEGVVRQMGEDYLVTNPEGNEMISGSEVAEIRF